jgi:phosphatidylserine/phosphatidylglycerophosphate/cardiolipin synthase-like enzyme
MSTPLPEIKLVINSAYRAEIVPLINSAKKSIDLLMYEWRWYKQDITTDASLINQCLLRAMRRGVKVRGLVNTGTQMKQLNEIGFDVRTNDAGTLMHSKSIIIDESIAVMGSHNLTNPAMRSNIETSLIVRNADVAKQLSNYFNSLWLS